MAYSPPDNVAVATPVTEPAAAVPARGRAKRPRCEDCFFSVNGLCALQDKKPCPTFRPAHADGLRPPQQLSFVFRQERRPEPFTFAPAQAWV
jgi:hypothetical protein